MRNGIFYIALSEKQGKKADQLCYDQAMTADLFCQQNNIQCSESFSDSCDWLWFNREGMIQILSYIENNPNTIDCVLVYTYKNLIWEQKDFNAMKAKLESLGVELISVVRGVIEIESEYYYNPLELPVNNFDNY